MTYNQSSKHRSTDLNQSKEKTLKTIIKLAKPGHYKEIIRIFNEAFQKKFNYITNNLKKQKEIVHDFNLLDLEKNRNIFVAENSTGVQGVLILKIPKLKKRISKPNITLFNIIEKYGIRELIRGLFMNTLFEYKTPENEVYVESLAVSSKARGLGIGSALLEFAEVMARHKKCQTISLQVMKENTGAKRLYERWGYSVIKSRSLKLITKATDYSEAFLMKKRLSA